MSLPENTEVTVEVFPIETDSLPSLYGYSIEAKGVDLSRVGGKLAYLFRKKFHGHWTWSNSRIITDDHPGQEDIAKVIESLWSEQPETFRHLRAVLPDPHWTPNSRTYADFAAMCLVEERDRDIRKILDAETRDVGSVRIERVYESRGWIVGGKPSVSVSLSSRLIYKQDLKSYASSLAQPEDLVGLWVSAKTSSLKGEIIGVEGRLRDHRSRLLALSHDERTQELIAKASDDELVINVESGRNQYEYAISALRIIVRTGDFARFNVPSSQALRTLRIEPSLRNNLVKRVSDLLRQRKILMESYNSIANPEFFLDNEDVGFEPSLRFGDGKAFPYDERTIFRNLRSFGLYRKSPRFEAGKPIRLGIVNGLEDGKAGPFVKTLCGELDDLGFTSKILPEMMLENFSRLDIERAVDSVEREEPDVVLALLPDSRSYDDEGGWGPYHEFKSLTVGRGLPSQFVYESTLTKGPAIGNVLLGILGKTGNIPFVLSQPLSYADLVVGIDIARERKKRLPGSLNATAIARIYFGNGEFLRYVIHDAPLEGESIPDNVLQRLFPVNDFKGKRVVIHRDGYFRGDEKESLHSWAQRIGAKFNLVEIIKTGTPRLYRRRGGQVEQPRKGSAFKLSPTEAFLVSSPPPFPDATAQPLHLRTDLPFTIEQAAHSVLSLTLLHHGSIKPPRLPVTIHYSDRIAYMALRGIKPKALEGTIPFWL